MRAKISDFKLAEFLAKKISEKKRIPFVDANIYFGSGLDVIGGLSIESSQNIGQTIYKIVEAYVGSQCAFDDESSRNAFLLPTATFLRTCIYADHGFEEGDAEQFHAMRLYQQPLVWTMLKDLICPVYGKDLLNYQVVVGSSPYVDISRFIDERSIDGNKPQKPVIFSNFGVRNVPVRSAFLLMSAIEASGLCPYLTIKEILESGLSEQFVGTVKLAFSDDSDVETFMSILVGMLGCSFNDFPHLEVNFSVNEIKIAQYSNNPMQWWYFGLIEKLLEPARGSDWGTYEALEPFVKEFWDKVEKYKQSKKNKEDGVPFDTLLRIKSEDFKTDPTRTIQSLLGSNRVW